jgi:alpha-mannosidase
MSVPGYVIKNKRTTLERAEKFISTRYFTDCNLIGRLYPKRIGVTSISHYAAPDRISYENAVKKGEFTKACVGETFGPTWSTHWFRLQLNIPEDWLGEEVRLVWDSTTEAMVWKDGKPVQGLSPENQRKDFILSRKLIESERSQELYVEMACNGLFGGGTTVDGRGDQISPPKLDTCSPLKTVDLVVIDRDVQALILDLEILIGLTRFLPEDSNRSYQALYVANDIVNTVVLDNRESYRQAHTKAESFFAQKNGETQHTVVAVGNCHIDTAWLWQYDETKRKCARSFSATIRLMEQYPDYTFACSQAQQFEWVKENYPTLFEQMRYYVSIGRFIPVGGSWIEMDGNIPSGEAFIRQFLLGQKFFEREFGIRCKEFWLPDTFGYSGQLPQIMKGCGISRFVTQKLSWNLVNKFPHNTFWWKGIDGSRVLTHFPPGDCYCMNGTVEEVTKSVNNFRDKGRSNRSLYLYGYGDGGQGPTEEMIERLRRMANTDGLPIVELSTPDKYFRKVEESELSQLCSWSGELYLELHNGTYTTQGETKMWNRKCELLLRDLEIISSLASGLAKPGAGYQYPSAELTRLWKLVLLNQFHDVLPGSSINAVYKDAVQFYQDVCKSSTALISEAVSNLTRAQGFAAGVTTPVVINTLSWTRHEVISLSPDDAQLPDIESLVSQTDSAGNRLVLVHAMPLGFTLLKTAQKPVTPVSAVEKENGQISIKNELLEAVIDKAGRIVELYCPSGSKKNAIADGELGNQFVIFDDIPLYWDAWDVMDYHLETCRAVNDVIQKATVVETGPLRATIEVTLKISDVSTIKQSIVLEAACPYLKFVTEVDWHESHKFLKVEFPLQMLSPVATYEIQFGHLQRATHFNTSWDWAKFEVCGHKWADVSEYGWGVAVLNDSKYGWSCIDNVLRLSLLRSSKSPDDLADMGTQRFTYGVMPHCAQFQSAGVIQAAYNLNNKLRVSNVATMPPEDAAAVKNSYTYINISSPAVIVEALKRAEDIPGALVLRLYEAFGSHTTANVTVNHLSLQAAQICDMLETPGESLTLSANNDNTFELTFAPFQVISVLLTFTAH